METVSKTLTAPTDAAEIYRTLCQISARAMFTGNFELFISCFHLPHKVTTTDGSCILRSTGELRDVLDGMRNLFKRLKVTRYERVVTTSVIHSGTRIVAGHESRMFRDQELVGQTSIALATAELKEGRWRLSESQYASEGRHPLSGFLNIRSGGN